MGITECLEHPIPETALSIILNSVFHCYSTYKLIEKQEHIQTYVQYIYSKNQNTVALRNNLNNPRKPPKG